MSFIKIVGLAWGERVVMPNRSFRSLVSLIFVSPYISNISSTDCWYLYSTNPFDFHIFCISAFRSLTITYPWAWICSNVSLWRSVVNSFDTLDIARSLSCGNTRLASSSPNTRSTHSFENPFWVNRFSRGPERLRGICIDKK